MALNAPRFWLICYDITDRRRLARFHRFLKDLALPVQYSVFCYEGSAAQLGRLVKDMESRIDPETDDVRVYQLPDTLQCDSLGRGSVPAGTTLLSPRQPGLASLLRGDTDCYDRDAGTPARN